MKNKKIINKNALLSNLSNFSHKKVCAMVKSNAYGHGIKEIVSILQEHVDLFGVVSVEEAIAVRKLTDKPILICSKVFDYKLCRKYDIDVMVDNQLDLLQAIKNRNKIHLKINSGMNRFGVKSKLELSQINKILIEKEIELQSIYTHFFNLESKSQTKKQYKKFCELKKEILQNAPVCFGGSDVIEYDFEYDMIRVGIGLYGYGKNLQPIEKICSYVCKVFYAKKGETLGYNGAFKVKEAGFFAVVALGYGDGLRRNLSGKFFVEINKKIYRSVGNICMDAFFVKVDNSVKVGDEVVVMKDANELKGDSIVYEVLTGFSNLRGKTIIK